MPVAKRSNAPVLLDNPVIKAVAQNLGFSPAQVLIAWHVNRGIATIPKSVTPSRLRDNLAAAEIVLSHTDMERIAALDVNYRFINGSFWAMKDSPWTLETIWDGP